MSFAITFGLCVPLLILLPFSPLRTIRRVVFINLERYNGEKYVPLRTSQVKQIAGRAGRFGMHGKGIQGVATTLRAEDLPILREHWGQDVPVISRARLDYQIADLERLYGIFGPDTPLDYVIHQLSRLARTGSNFILVNTEPFLELAAMIEEHASTLSLQEKLLWRMVPVRASDPAASVVIASFLRAQVAGAPIKMSRLLKEHGLLSHHFNIQRQRLQYEKEVELRLQADDAGKVAPPRPDISPKLDSSSLLAPMRPITQKQLQSLELAHNLNSAYLWLSYRLPLVFNDPADARELRDELQRSLQFALSQLTSDQLEPVANVTVSSAKKGSKKTASKASKAGKAPLQEPIELLRKKRADDLLAKDTQIPYLRKDQLVLHPGTEAPRSVKSMTRLSEVM